jgi:hypothetical protein
VIVETGSSTAATRSHNSENRYSKINFLKAIEIEKLVEFLDRAKLEFSRCQKTPQKSLSKTL